MTFHSQVLANPSAYSEQDVYHATLQTSHRVGAWLQILDENERPMWELPEITDGGVSFDISQSPDRSLDLTVLDVKGRLLSGMGHEEAMEARRFVRLIYEVEVTAGWLRFPIFTGPLSSGGLRRQGAEVQITATGKESAYLAPFVTWTHQHFPKGTPIIDVIHDLAYDMGERRFRLPDGDDAKLAKRFVVPQFSEAWRYIQRAAARIGRVPYFDGEGYLNLRMQNPKTVGYTFDETVVLTVPELDDDYTTIVNAAMSTGPDPDGPVKPLHIPAFLPPGSPFSPQHMARHGVPRRAVASDDVNWDWHEPWQEGKKPPKYTKKQQNAYYLQIEDKKRASLAVHSQSMLRTARKSLSFDALPIPHVLSLLGHPVRIVGEYEEQPVSETFILRSGFFPAVCTNPMTIGSWRPLAVNWKAKHPRPGMRP